MDQQGVAAREVAAGVRVTPPPVWVELAPYPIPARPNPHFIASGVCTLLDESQIDICGPTRAWFYRRADMITASGGAERAAQFQVSYDPAFETVDIHTVTVIRGGERIDYAPTANFEVLRRERNLEQLQVDGRVTVHLTLPDVRPGDVVETAYTAYGVRQSLGGRLSTFIAFEWAVGIIEVRVRVRRPADRTVFERGYCDAPQASETQIDGVIDRRWRTHERPGIRFEPLAPPWVLQNAAVQLSEWRNWAEVVEVFTPLYTEDGPLPQAIEDEIARIAASEATPAGRAAAALRYAQNAVRYLAISMGEGGYTPRTIEAIAATRYGDCKDKSKLLAAMGRRLGFDACPALVNTRDGNVLNTWLPSAQVFDHCIVRIAIDGRVYWVDPTRALQPSPLDKVNQCHFGWALPLRDGVVDLEPMPAPSPAHTLETEEVVTLGPSPDQPVRYEFRSTSRRGRAEWVREHLAREGAVGLFKAYSEDLRRRYGAAEPLRQEIERDDEAANEVTTHEVYEVRDGWMEAPGNLRQFGTHDLTMRTQLAPLDAGQPKHPIYLGQVGKVSRRVVVETAYDMPLNGWKRAVDGSTLSFKSELRKESARRFVLDQSLSFGALTLPNTEADKYRAVITALEESDIVFSATLDKRGFFVGSKEHRDRQRANALWFTLLWVALIGGVAALRMITG